MKSGNLTGVDGQPLLGDHRNELVMAAADNCAQLADLLNHQERAFAEAMCDAPNWTEAARKVWPGHQTHELAHLSCLYLRRPNVRSYLESIRGFTGLTAASMFERSMARLEAIACDTAATVRQRLDANIALAKLSFDALQSGIIIDANHVDVDAEPDTKAITEGDTDRAGITDADVIELEAILVGQADTG